MANIEEMTEEEVFADDRDPLEAIRELRKKQGVPEEDLEELKAAADDNKTAEDEIKDEEKDEKEEDNKELEAFDDKKEEEEKTEEEGEKKETTDNNDLPDEEDEKNSEKEKSDKEETSDIFKFKANGQEFEFTQDEIIEQFGTVFGQAMNYTQKMQKIAPYRKMISALESEGVTAEALNVAIDALKGDKGAIKTLIEANEIDPFELADKDEDTSPYIPTIYGKDETQLAIEDVVSEIESDPEYQITATIVDRQWDQDSRDQLASNPEYIMGLHNDVKTGVYDKVAPVAAKMKVLDGGRKSDIEYYILAGQQVIAADNGSDNKSDNQQTQQKPKTEQEAKQEFQKASSEAAQKRSAAATPARADSNAGVIDYLDDDDEAFDAWYNKLMRSN